MSLITSPIPNLVNGVSQQPDILRLSSQGDKQLNCLSSVAEGLLKRPPTEWVAKLEGVGEDAYQHTINRDSTERYQVVIEGSDIRVFDLQGVEKTVNKPDGVGYLTALDNDTAYHSLTVADFTFVLNKEVKTLADTTLSTGRDPEALIWVKQGSYGNEYSIKINGVERASYTVPDGSTSTHTANVATEYIANHLTTDLNLNASGYTAVQYGSTIHLVKDNLTDFTVRADSGGGDTHIKVIKDSVQAFSDLPARAVDNFIVEIAGDNTSTFDNYYVRFESGASTSLDGVWKETILEGEEYKLDTSTMPHALVREADGTFTFKQLTWNNRVVGDNESSPMPSYIGRVISDVFFFRNRLGFSSDENIVFSKAGDFFNFFRGTATQVLDDDPIDVSISHVKVSIIRQVVPFNESLLLFSDQTQFQTGATPALTPETISINPTTEYECSLDAKPVGVGKYVYFATKHGNFSGVREYFVDKDTESEQAAEITAHVPKYIKGKIRQINASSSEDMLTVLTDEDPTTLYIYKFYFSGEDKLQASWSKWQTADNAKIISSQFIESNLYILVGRDDGVHLEVVNLSAEVFEENWGIRVHLDSKINQDDVTVVATNSVPTTSGNDAYEVTLPYKVADDEPLHLVIAPDGVLSKGVVHLDFLRDNTGVTTKLYYDVALVGENFFIGRPYDSRYRLSRLLVKEKKRDGSQVPISNGRLQLRKLTVLMAQTGYLRAEVTPLNRPTYTYVFTGNIIGSEALIGEVNIADGELNVPVQSKNDQVEIEFVNDTYLPSAVLSLDWEGLYSTRAQRV